MHDESCVSGESRTVGCESKGRARGGSVVLRRRRRADVVVIRKHPRVDETRRASSERSVEKSIKSRTAEEPASTYVAEVRDAADRREGREVRIDRSTSRVSLLWGHRQRGGRSRWVTASFFEEYAVRDDDAVTDGWIWMGVDGLLRRPGRRGDDGDDGDDGKDGKDEDDREGLPSMRWVGCGRATTTKRRVAGWRLRRCPRG